MTKPTPATEDERKVDPQIKAIADAWLTHQGYKPDEIKDPDHSLCEMIAGVGWDCTDEEGRDRHPEYAALYQASEMANVALEAIAESGFCLTLKPDADALKAVRKLHHAVERVVRAMDANDQFTRLVTQVSCSCGTYRCPILAALEGPHT